MSRAEHPKSSKELSSAGRNALVAAEPFHPNSAFSPLNLSNSSGGTKGPLAAAATVMEAGRPVGTELTENVTDELIASPHFTSSETKPSFRSNFIFEAVSGATEVTPLETGLFVLSDSTRENLDSLDPMFFSTTRPENPGPSF
nr:hypothetical protein CDL12_27175 [Ipomoea batatas]